MKIIDCDQRGLICEDSLILSWDEIETIGKTEYPGREIAWATYYLRKKNQSRNIRLSTLGSFPFFRNKAKEEREKS